MPAIHSITSDQLAAVRSGGYAGEIRFAVCPNNVVFVAEVDETITNSVFFSFAWANTISGDYEDVNPGQTFYITETDDPAELRNPLFQGRVTQSPTSTEFFCNEASFNLQAGYVVTVIDAYEIRQKDRSGALVDGYQTFETLPPVVKNMQSFYYGEDDTEFQFSFAPVGQAMEKGAAVVAYHWTIPGATYDVGDEDTQNITVTVPAGHIWAFLDVTDDNDVTHRFKFQILVCGRDDSDFMFMAHDSVEINSELEAGLNASTTLFAGVENLLNRTRCAIVAFDTFRDDNPEDPVTEPLFNQVMFVGYIVQETTDVTADERSSLLSQTRFELQSFAAVAAQLPVPSLAIRDRTTPAAWEQIDEPTPQRVIVHIAARYSTLFDLVAPDMVYTDSTWFAGEMDLEPTTLMDSIRQIAEEIDARLVFFPQGDCTLEIDASALSESDRNALPDLIDSGNLTTSDLFSYSLPVPYYDQVGQLQVGYASFQTDGADPFKIKAIAPATARSEGTEEPVVLAKLLAADLTQAQAIAAAKIRVGNLFEYMQPPQVLPLTFHDGWRFLTVSSRVWVKASLAATLNTRGIPITTADRYLLQSVTLRWNLNGTWDISGTARLETVGGQAQVSAVISPNIVVTDNPVLPIEADYDAYAPDGTLNYLSTDVDDADRQPYGPYDLGQYSPMTTEDAANAADNMPDPNCAIISPPLNFKSNATRLTPRATVNGQIYVLTLKGSAKLFDAAWTHHSNFINGEDGYESSPDQDGATYVPFSGYGASSDPDFAGRGHIVILFDSPTYVDSVDIGRDSIITPGGFGGGTLAVGNWDGVTSTIIAQANQTELHTILTIGQVVDGLFIAQFNTADPAVPPLNGFMTSATVRGQGTNPYTLEPGAETFGDAFYQWEEGGEAELYSANRGLRINSNPVSVPPEYNDNHTYTVLYTGDGNQTPLRYELEDYGEAQNQILYARVCGPNMGV